MLVQSKVEVCVGVEGPCHGFFDLWPRIPVQAKFKICSSVHSGTKGLSLMFRSVEMLPVPCEICSSVRWFGGPSACPNKI